MLGAEKEGGEDIKHVNIQVGTFTTELESFISTNFDNVRFFDQDEKNLELMKSQQSGAGGANKDLRWELLSTKVWSNKLVASTCLE